MSFVIAFGELPAEMLPHQDRVLNERRDLARKTNALEAFILGETFQTLPEREQELMSQQLEYMALYLQVLNIRVADITGSKQYTCNKQVMARTMHRGTFYRLMGWDLPEGESPLQSGYLVESLDGSEPNHPEFASYISWMPADEFELNHKENP
jgi:hypothetical protein